MLCPAPRLGVGWGFFFVHKLEPLESETRYVRPPRGRSGSPFDLAAVRVCFRACIHIANH
jgi:hypothetical protein